MYNRHEYSGLMKKCIKCNTEKPLTEFCNRKGEVDGKHRYCKLCLNQDFKSYYHSSGRKDSDYYKTYREQNKEYFNTYCHNHYHTKKELYREWNKTKYDTDLKFKLKHITSSRISQALKTYQTLKQNRTIEYLGCSMEEYTQYIEKQFTLEMTWENYGIYWEIDHVKPIDAFDLNDENQLYEAFHYTNTQPLSKLDNRKKSNKF